MPTLKEYKRRFSPSRGYLNLGEQTPATRKVYHALHSYIKRFPTAYPSQSRLAENSGLALRTVRRSIACLRKSGILNIDRSEIQKSRHRTNRYSLSDQWKILNSPTPQIKSKVLHNQSVSSQIGLSTKLKACTTKPKVILSRHEVSKAFKNQKPRRFRPHGPLSWGVQKAVDFYRSEAYVPLCLKARKRLGDDLLAAVVTDVRDACARGYVEHPGKYLTKSIVERIRDEEKAKEAALLKIPLDPVAPSAARGVSG